MNLILKAAQFAEMCHRGQFRKYNGTPYIWHPMRVAGRMMIFPMSSEQAVAAAWLHDVIEDCGLTEAIVADHFGDDVAGIVRQLTNPSIGLKLPRAERKRMDREHIAAGGLSARRIKLLDRIDNLREMSGSDTDFLSLYQRESKLLLQALRGTDTELEDELETLLGNSI